MVREKRTNPTQDTTLRLDVEVWKRLRMEAAERGWNLSRLANLLLKEGLDRSEQSQTQNTPDRG